MKSSTDYSQEGISKALKDNEAFYAYSQSQFDDKKVPGTKYVDMGNGLVCPKVNSANLRAAYKLAVKKGRADDIAVNGIENIIRRELGNHECFSSGDIDDVVDALKNYGVEAEQVREVYNKVNEETAQREDKGSRDLMFGHLGSGISVSDRNHEEHGDYQKIAHIKADRSIEYYIENVEAEYKAEIEQFANTADPNISTTQDGKVFSSRPAGVAEEEDDEDFSFSPR